MDAVADDFANSSSSKPIFITQSNNIEKFGHITEKTHKLIYKAFGIEHDAESNGQDSEKRSIPESKNEEPQSIFDLITKKSQEACFSEEKLLSFIHGFNSEMSTWNDEVQKAYSIVIDDTVEPRQVPNRQKLGEWLDKNKEKNYFAYPTYDTESYQVEEYKALPEKPNKNSFASLRRMALWHEDNTEYKLETVTRSRRFIDGFEYSHDLEKRILKVLFEPKLEIVDQVCLYVIPIYSNKGVAISFSYEFIQRRNWNSYLSPKCERWKNIIVNINSPTSDTSAANHIKKDLENWLTDAIKKIIE